MDDRSDVAISGSLLGGWEYEWRYECVLVFDLLDRGFALERSSCISMKEVVEPLLRPNSSTTASEEWDTTAV